MARFMLTDERFCYLIRHIGDSLTIEEERELLAAYDADAEAWWVDGKSSD